MEHCTEKGLNPKESPQSEANLIVKGLSFIYEGASEPALRDISFTAARGEFITICGASGCGKSTLLRQLKSCLTPSGSQSGEIFFSGRPLSQTDEREQTEKIAFVSQSPDAQCVTDKVWHELAFALESLGMEQSMISRRIAETAAFFGIEEILEKNTDELSGGQKQILALASAMAVQPSVLLLDEPTSQLDPVAAFEFVSLLGRINRELSAAVIVCEHSLSELLPLSSRVLVMSQGRIVCDGKPQDCAKTLYKNNDPSFLSFPAAARMACYNGIPADEELPLSITQGRKYLSEVLSEKQALQVPVRNNYARDNPVISLKDIYFRYERNTPDVLKGLSLDIYGGEQLCIFGGNGSGKTTLLKILSGVAKAYSGRIKQRKKPAGIRIAYMPQQPELLFIRSTVREELSEAVSGMSREEADREIARTVQLCRLEGLLDRHPFDISGGEAQRLALAKLVLTKPSLLLLDEPAKGLDCADKRRFAMITEELCRSGTAIVTVTHDTEYAALYSQRCAMLFRGRIVSCESPQNFFSQNGLYTTECARISRGMIDNAVTLPDIMTALGNSDKDDSFTSPPVNSAQAPEKKIPQNEKKRSLPIRLLSLGMLAVFVMALAVTSGLMYLPFFSENVWASFGALFISASLFAASSGRGRGRLRIKKIKRSRTRAVISALLILIAVPLTAVWGVFLLEGTKYLFISLLILIESMAAYHIILGSGHLRTRELVVTALLCAVCTAGRAAFYMLPACKPVTAIVIIAAVSLGSETGFLTGMTSMLLSNIFFGQGVWTPWQMLAMGLTGYITGLLFTNGFIHTSRMTLAIWGGFAAFVIYGGIMDPTALILSGTPINFGSLAAVYGAGLPINTIHAVTTAVFIYILGEPMLMRLERLKTKYRMFV